MAQSIHDYLALIEKEISGYSFGENPSALYDPIRYILQLGGKRLRPLLTLLSYSLYRNDVGKIAKAAVAVEVFHNFTLMHDDIMDNAPLRRGKKTVHEKWNPNIAILSGDVMMIKTYDMLLESSSPNLGEIIRKFNKCASQVCEGQQLDMLYESESGVTEVDYLDMIRLKTAVLLGYSLELGGILADAPRNQCDVLREIGQNIGIGFQLKDDLLDVYADKVKFGKQVGGDIIANKKTYLLIKALELADGEDKDVLKYWLEQKIFDAETKVKQVTQIYDRLNIREATESLMNEYFNRGLQQFELLEGNGENKTLLRDFFVQLINREK